jgi:hypothetical protein
MQIYFAGSIRGGREDAAIYHHLITHLKRFGQVLTEHVGNLSLTEKGDDGPNDRYIYERDMLWLSACNAVVAEVSKPSLGVGYELGQAVASAKPVLCLSRQPSDRSLSAMINGCPLIKVIPYASTEEARQAIDGFMGDMKIDRDKEK